MSTFRKEKTNKKAVIYTRVSTEEQAQTGYSLANQEDILRRECQRFGIEVAKHFQDDDFSAKTFNRPAFQELLEYVKIKENEINYLYIVRWDRFSRNIENAYEMISRLRKYKVEVRCLEEQLNTNDPASPLLRALKLAEPEMDNRRRALNTKMGLQRAKKEGRYAAGKAPIGYVWSEDSKNKPILIPGIEASHILEAFELYSSGLYSLEGVRKILMDKGLKISKSQFCEIMRNPIYAGKIRFKEQADDEDELIQGIHQPIISYELFQRVQEIIKKVRLKHQGCIKKAYERDEMPLRGFLKCPECGSTLTGSGSSGNGGTYFYYHCHKRCRTRFRADNANNALVEHLGSFTALPEITNLYMAIMEDTFKSKEGDRDKQVADLQNELEVLESKLLKIDQKYVDDALDADSYQRLKTHIKEQICNGKNRIEQLRSIDTNFMKYCSFGMTLLTHLDVCYQEASLELKRKLIGSIFPEKLVFEKGIYRTAKMNPAVELIGQFQRELGNKKDGRFSFERKTSDHVPAIGLEPTLYC